MLLNLHSKMFWFGASPGQRAWSRRSAAPGADGAAAPTVNSMWADRGRVPSAGDVFGPGVALLFLLHLLVGSESS